MRRKSGVEKKMQITYQNEWEYTNIHVDLPIPYEEDYQIKMIHYNKIKGMLPRYRTRRAKPIYISSGKWNEYG